MGSDVELKSTEDLSNEFAKMFVALMKRLRDR
jgi:hypothetical protein